MADISSLRISLSVLPHAILLEVMVSHVKVHASLLSKRHLAILTLDSANLEVNRVNVALENGRTAVQLVTEVTHVPCVT